MPLNTIKRILTSRAASPAKGAVLYRGRSDPSVRLSWVWTTATHPDANLGDALSAVVTAAIGHLPVARAAFNSSDERLAAVGTIGHALHNGRIHLWGTGFDLARDVTGANVGYTLPINTDLVPHAVRGRETGNALRQRGLSVPEIYGDPVWFLPKIFPDPCTKLFELGVIVHISELERPRADAVVRKTIERYKILPEQVGKIKIINTYAAATLDGLRQKTDEILSCRRILSTSLHGLVIAEAYGIPCAWFPTYFEAPGRLPIGGKLPIDHRMRDFYSGTGQNYVLSYPQPLSAATDWIDAIRFLDENWRQIDYSGADLFNAFPLRKNVKFEEATWHLPQKVLENIPI